MRRRGFSVVEVVVAAAIAVVAFALLLHLFRSSRRTSESAEARNELLQEGRILLETLKGDLRGIRVDGKSPESAPAYADNGVRLLRDAGDAEGAGDPETVTWKFDRTGRRVERASSLRGNRIFGDDRVEVRFFDIRPERIKAGLLDAQALHVTLRLARKGDAEGKEFPLFVKFFPPMLQGGGEFRP